MAVSYAAAAAIIGPVIGVVHSSFAKSYGLGGLYPDNDIKRRIMTLVWHLPSLTWAALTLAILTARLTGTSNLPLTFAAAFIFCISGIGNLSAHRKPFIGGILLLAVTALILLDWLTNV